MTRRSRLVRGQGMIEYLLVVSAIIAAILAVRTTVQTNAQRVIRGAINKIPTP